MKKIIIFLLLIVFAFCHIDEAKREELRQRRKEEMKHLAECLLKHPNTSEELKKAIKESPDDCKKNPFKYGYMSLTSSWS